MNPKKNHLSTNLKYLLGLSGLTQTQLSAALGFANSSISNYINKKSEPGPDKLIAIADYFNISTDDLMKRNLKEEGINKKTDNPRQADPEVMDMLKRYERLLQEIEQDKSVTEDDYRRLWETVREHAPELAKRIEGEFKH